MSVHDLYKHTSDLPVALPVFPLTGVLLLPRGQLPLNIFEPRYLDMTNDAMSSERVIGMLQPRTKDDAEDISDPAAKPNLQAVGCAGRITSFAETGDGRILITLTGIMRFRVSEELRSLHAYRRAQVDYPSFEKDLQIGWGEDEVDRDSLIRTFKTYVEKKSINVDWDAITEASTEALVNGLSMASPFGLAEKQALLEADTLKDRAQILIALTEMSLAGASGQDNAPLQ